MKRLATLVPGLLALTLLPPTGVARSSPSITHVVVVMEENHDYSKIIGSSAAPYINSLAKTYGLATNYYAITHPSLPNYLALTSGTTGQGAVSKDCLPAQCPQPGASIFGQLTGNWRGYAESMQTACEKSNAGSYAPKHNPAVYFTRISAAACKADDQSLPNLATAALGAYTMIAPNLLDDMHNGTIAEGDTWLKNHLSALMLNPAYVDGSTVVFVVWDEGTTDNNHVACLVISPRVLATTNATAFTHYSLLATAEDLLGLPRLGAAQTATSMRSAFGL